MYVDGGEHFYYFKKKVQQFDIVQVYKNKRLNLCIVTLIFYLS